MSKNTIATCGDKYLKQIRMLFTKLLLSTIFGRLEVCKMRMCLGDSLVDSEDSGCGAIVVVLEKVMMTIITRMYICLLHRA